MWKFSIWLFAFEAFFKGVESEIFCINQVTQSVWLSKFFIDPDGLCKDVAHRFESVRKGIENCTRHKINIDRLECVANDFCTPGSKFRQSFKKSKQCLFENLGNISNCNANMESEMIKGFENEEVIKNGIKAKEICTRDVELRFQREREGVEKCTRHKISLGGMECATNDFCTPGSVFRQSFNKSYECLYSKLDYIPNCMERMISEMRTGFQNEEVKKNGIETKQICTRSFQVMLNCTQRMTEICGDEAMKVFKHMVGTLKSLMVGVCFVSAGGEADLIEMETPKLECIYQATVSAANSVSILWITVHCSIIMGVFIAVKMIHV